MKKQDHFSSRMLVRFFVPSVISTFALSFGNIINALVVGRAMSGTGLAAVAFISPVFMFINLMNIAFATGGSTAYTKKLGEGLPEKAEQSFNQTLQATLIAGIVAAILGVAFLSYILSFLGVNPNNKAVYAAAYEYAMPVFLGMPIYFLSIVLYHFVRCAGAQKRATLGFSVGVAGEIVLNILFVLVLDLGIYSAVCATLIARLISIVIYSTRLFGKKAVLHIRPCRCSLKDTWTVWFNGFAFSSNHLFSLCTLILTNRLITNLGGSDALAMFCVIANTSYVLQAIYDGTVEAVSPICTIFTAEHNRKASHEALRSAIKLGTLCSCFVIVACMVFANQVCQLFNLSPEIIHSYGTRALCIYCLSVIPRGMLYVLSSYNQAIGVQKMSFAINLMRGIIMYVPMLFLFLQGSIQNFWYMFVATEVLSLAAWGVMRRFINEKKTSDVPVLHKTIIDKQEDFTKLLEETQTFCQSNNANLQQSNYVSLAIEEVCAAIIKNGFTGNRDEYIELTLVAENDGSFTLHIRDSAQYFDPFAMETSLGDAKPESLGILIVKQTAKEFVYNRYQGFNSLTVRV